MPRNLTRDDLDRVCAVLSRHHGFVYRLAYRLLRNQADAEDLTQAVFLQLLRSPASLARVASERAWLARITWTQAASWRRSEARRRQRELSWAQKQPRTTESEAMNADERVSEAILSLPDDLRIPVLLHYQEGMKYREIAAVCNCPEGTVARRLARAKDELRRRLAPGGAGALLPALGTGLKLEAAIPVPAGLEARLRAAVEQEFAALSGSGAGGGAGAPAGAASVLPGGISLTLVSGILLSGLLATAGWFGIERAVRPEGARVSAHGALATEGRVQVRPATGAPRRMRPHLPETAGSRGEPVATEPAGAAAPAAPEEEQVAASPVLFGWIRDPRGKPLEGVAVEVREGDNDRPAATAVTDAEGYYEVASVTPVQDVLAGQALWKLQTYIRGEQLQDLDADGLQDVAVYRATVAADPELGVAAERQVMTWDARGVAEHEKHLYQREAAMAEFERAMVAVRQRTCTGGGADSGGTGAAAGESCKSCHQEPPSVRVDARVRFLDTHGVVPPAPPAAGKLQLTARLDGYRIEVSRPFALEDGQPLELSLTLERTVALAGMVLAVDGTPIAQAEVSVVAHVFERLLPASAVRTATDEAGGFRLSSLPGGIYAVKAAAPGFLPGEATLRTGEASVIWLTPSGSARVKAARNGGAEPLNDLRVELRGEAGSEEWTAAEAVTGSAAPGEAVFPELAPGGYRVRVFRGGAEHPFPLAAADLLVAPGVESPVLLEVPGEVRLAGRVVLLSPPAGAPPSLSVTAARLDDRGKREGGPFSLELAPDGAFDFGSLPPGRYTLEVTLSGAGSPRDRLAGRDVDLREGEPPADLVILASLPLRVADAPGEGVRARRPTPRNIEIGPLFANAESKPEAPSLPGGDQPIAIQAPVTLRVLLDLLAAGGLLAVDIEPGVEASGVLERAHAAGPSVRPLREQLQEALGANGLRLEAEAGRLRIVR